MSDSHFKGKEVVQHLYDARLKGKAATSEVHGAELPGHFFSCFDAIKETAMLMLILHLLAFPTYLFITFILLFMVYKFGRSSLLGWIRLQRLHRLIEEERWEIEHHRHQERKELEALYQAKGFSGRLLQEVVDVLMADDNRLLQVMLEEELGLTLEAFEHPLKQGLGALVGVLIAGVVLYGCLFIPYGIWVGSLLLVAITAALSAKKEQNPVASSVIWNVSLTLLIGLLALFLNNLL